MTTMAADPLRKWSRSSKTTTPHPGAAHNHAHDNHDDDDDHHDDHHDDDHHDNNDNASL